MTPDGNTLAQMAAGSLGVSQMVEWLRALVESESPSVDVAACTAAADTVAVVTAEILGQEPQRVIVDGRPHLRWRSPTRTDGRQVCLIGHFDTVWPLGTIEQRPFLFDPASGRASGPGVFDMKAGIVQLLCAVAALDDRSGIEILLTSDEEIGSSTSRPMVEEVAKRSAAALVFEPSADGALKTSRSGSGTIVVDIAGRASHAGLDPVSGFNALTELGHVLSAIRMLASDSLGATITPTIAAAGTASNMIPGEAHLELDIRIQNPDEGERLVRAVSSLRATVHGTSLTVTGGVNRPPMTTELSAIPFAVAQRVAARIGMLSLEGVEVGGASDGNFTASVGCPTLDGLGAVGGGAHAESEWVSADRMPERTALAAGIIKALLDR